jgi:uncharacterized metal-binding protein YceD (DUF177 family)
LSFGDETGIIIAMKDKFKIYIDRLREGTEENFSFSTPSTFMEIEEKELRFLGDIEITGTAYTTDDYLIINLQAKTRAESPCSICNGPVTLEISLDNFYHAEPLEDIRGAIFDYSAILRESLLLEIPAFIECGDPCPERSSIERFLCKENPEKVKEYFPFESL